jgi:hypothetical protein
MIRRVALREFIALVFTAQLSVHPRHIGLAGENEQMDGLLRRVRGSAAPVWKKYPKRWFAERTTTIER